jgi:hypothetical protein
MTELDAGDNGQPTCWNWCTVELWESTGGNQLQPSSMETTFLLINFICFVRFSNNYVDDYVVQSFRQWYALWDGSYAERQRSNAFNVRHQQVFNLNGGPSVYGRNFPITLDRMVTLTF